MNNYIYADNSSTTKLNPFVLNKMMPYLKDCYGNASTPYELGKMSKKAIEAARKNIANCLNVSSEEIIFTGSGTEADNLALLGIARANKEKGRHIITSKFEHLAVYNTCKQLEKEGFDVTYVDINPDGIVNIEKLKEAIREDTILISIMMVNNEIGTIQPVDKIAQIAKEKNIIFHTDAVQGVPHIKIDASKYSALSLSAHKFNGPKGVGALYLKKDTKIENITFGGHQENGLRPATENVAGIVGMSEALINTNKNLCEYNKKEKMLRDYLLLKLGDINGFNINGTMQDRIESNLNFYIEGIDSESLKLYLEINGIYVSSGSACNSNVKEVSHVLKSIGKDNSAIRISLSNDNTIYEMDVISYYIHKSLKILNKKRNVITL